MLGAIIGDVVGSAFEGMNRTSGTCMKDYNFPLFTAKSHYTDDSVCTMAVAETVMHPNVYKNDFKISLLHWCRRYPNAGYGGNFRRWFESPDPQPYESFGNGSAMRVSPVGVALLDVSKYIYDEDNEVINSVLERAKQSALPSHGHPEGIKGAQATAIAVTLALNNIPKEHIKEYIEKKFEYDLSTPLETIRPTYGFDVTCQGSVPQAIRCFLESTDFLSCIRLAVSLGGDSDTQAAIAGGIAHAFYKKIPEQMVVETFARLPAQWIDLILRFHEQFGVEF